MRRAFFLCFIVIILLGFQALSPPETNAQTFGSDPDGILSNITTECQDFTAHIERGSDGVFIAIRRGEGSSGCGFSRDGWKYEMRRYGLGVAVGRGTLVFDEVIPSSKVVDDMRIGHVRLGPLEVDDGIYEIMYRDPGGFARARDIVEINPRNPGLESNIENNRSYQISAETWNVTTITPPRKLIDIFCGGGVCYHPNPESLNLSFPAEVTGYKWVNIIDNEKVLEERTPIGAQGGGQFTNLFIPEGPEWWGFYRLIDSNGRVYDLIEIKPNELQSQPPGPPSPPTLPPPPSVTPGSSIPRNFSFIPCGETDDEFHSLRPYPGSPCNQLVDENPALMCGNDLITRQEITASPLDADASCTFQRSTDRGTRIISCEFEKEREIEVTIDLTEAELPIVGNTQLVRHNSELDPDGVEKITEENELTDEIKVNNFVSWYLNGAYNRAEEEYLSYEGPEDVSTTDTDINRVINFSGPINKLLPFRVQLGERVRTIEKAVDTINSEEGPPNIRHNQVVGCTIGGGISLPSLGRVGLSLGIPIPCYDQDLFGRIGLGILPDIGIPTARHRLEDWEVHFPPFEEDEDEDGNYKNASEYLQAYKEWRGQECKSFEIIDISFFLCFQDPTKLDFWGNLFAYIPLSSTEDRLGEVELARSRLSGQPREDEGSETRITQIDFISTSRTDKLFFAHMQETTELASLLQDTFVSKQETGNKRVGGAHTKPVDEGRRCEVASSKKRGGPGDDLLGELDRTEGEDAIRGTIQYTAQFSCEFEEIITPNGATFDPSLCTRVALTSSEVSLRAPDEAKNVWNQLVGGAQSIAKRVFPQQVYPAGKTSVDEFEELPAVTQANYGLDVGGSDGQIFAGRISNPGTNAELYIPHVGGYKEYFLDGIQQALRPKGFGPNGSASDPSRGTASGTCDPGTGLCDASNLSVFGAEANNASQICQEESGGSEIVSNLSCFDGGLDYSIGLFQINLLFQNTLDGQQCFRAFAGHFDEQVVWHPEIPCRVVDQELLDSCVAWFENPENNIGKAAQVQAEQGWRLWATAPQCGL